MRLFSQQQTRGTWRGPYSLKDPALAELFGAGSRTLAGPVVTELMAYTVDAFWCGVNKLGSDIAKTPLNLLKRRKEGGSEHYTDAPAYKLLKYSPNPETRSLVFRRTLTAHAIVYGNGYAEIVRDRFGRPAALWLLHPSRVRPYYDTKEVEQDGRRSPLRYLVDGQTIFAPRDILHIQGLSDDGVTGFNLVSVAREALGLALASERFASAFFGNGTRFGGILMKKDEDLDDDQAEDIRKKVEALHAKADKAFRLLVLGSGFEYKETGVKPSEAEMSKIRDQQTIAVARFLDMPLHTLKMAIPGAVSYASVEMADLDYYKGPIVTWMRSWEEELDAKLISPLEIGRQYFKHNNNAFLRGDNKTRYDAFAVMLDRGVFCADDVLELEDMNPQPNGQGKMYLIQGAQVPKDKIEALTDANIKKSSTPPQPPATPPKPDAGETNAQLEEALAVAAEYQRKASDEHEKRIAAEAAGIATKEEIGRLVASEDAARALANELTMLAERMRVDAEHERAVAAAATERASAADGERDTAMAAAAAALSKVNAAEAAEGEAKRLASEAESRASAATEGRQAAEMELGEARTALESAQAALAEATGQIDTLRQQIADLDAAAVATADERARQATYLAELRASVETLESTRDVLAGNVQRLEGDVAAAQAAVAAQATEAARAVELSARLEAERSARLADADSMTAMEAAALARRRDEYARMTNVVTAHRALIADVARRLVERETERARSRQQDPDKLRGWVETFYLTFEDAFTEALVPALRVHLAWKQSTDDPRTAARTIAKAHCEESVRQLRAIAGAVGEDFDVAVAHVLKVWERDRPEQLADALLKDEIAHLQAMEREP